MRKVTFILVLSLFALLLDAKPTLATQKSYSAGVKVPQVQIQESNLIFAKKRLSKKKAAALYLQAVCPANAAAEAWTGYDSEGNFSAETLHASAQYSIAVVNETIRLLSNKKWPTKVKKSWVNGLLKFYKEELWLMSGYLYVTDELGYEDLQSRDFNEYRSTSQTQANKIRKALGLPPIPGGC
jgi:hypothetical protein